MNIGKLKNDELENLILNKYKKVRMEVECSPKVGVDCAKVRVGETCILSSDPITAATNRIGYLTVHVNCNDAAAAGAEPIGLLVTLLAPPSTTPDELSSIANDISLAAQAANVDIIGGHTEITTAVTRIITSATVIAKPVSEIDGKMHIGDSIILTKTVGLEGSAVISHDYANKISLSDSELETAKNMINAISVVPEGVYAAANGAHAMHDITEGGVLGAVWEMAYSSGIGCIIDIDSIPIHEVTKKMCSKLGINPYRLLSSGSMLISCENGEEMVQGLASIGVQATIIGKAIGTQIVDTNGKTIEPPEADELYKLDI